MEHDEKDQLKYRGEELPSNYRSLEGIMLATCWHPPTPCSDETFNTKVGAEFLVSLFPEGPRPLDRPTCRLDRAINQSINRDC